MANDNEHLDNLSDNIEEISANAPQPVLRLMPSSSATSDPDPTRRLPMAQPVPIQQPHSLNCPVCPPYLLRFCRTGQQQCAVLIPGYVRLENVRIPVGVDAPAFMRMKLLLLDGIAARLDNIMIQVEAMVAYPEAYPDPDQEIQNLRDQAFSAARATITGLFPGATPAKPRLKLLRPVTLDPLTEIGQIAQRFSALHQSLAQVYLDCPHHAF